MTATISAEFKSNFDQYYSLLIVVPEEVESHETVNVLNFFGFPLEIEEDNILKPIIKREMGFSNSDPYPCLMIDSNHNEI